MTGPATLVGVGMGPGDPDLVTVKALKVLARADQVLVPVMDLGTVGRAEATVLAHLDPERLRRVVFALNERDDTPRREAAWDEAAQVAVDLFDGGASMVAFATIGDPNVYSTFSYLADTVRRLRPDTVIETVPGITAMQDLAARAGVPLVEGTESLALFPMTAGFERFADVLDVVDTVVTYKGGRHLPKVIDQLRRSGRADRAVIGAALGLRGERIEAAASFEGELPYLSTVISPARRDSRGGRL